MSRISAYLFICISALIQNPVLGQGVIDGDSTEITYEKCLPEADGVSLSARNYINNNLSNPNGFCLVKTYAYTSGISHLYFSDTVGVPLYVGSKILFIKIDSQNKNVLSANFMK